MKYIRAKHDRDLLTVEFVAEDGTRYLRSGGTICWRFFNPGNIRPSKTSVCNALKIGTGDTKSGRFMIFPDYDTGWEALKQLLRVSYKDSMVRTVARAYAPTGDGNDPEKYTSFIVRKAVVNADDYIRDMDNVTLERVMEAIKQMEGYYNKEETQQENIIQATNITISDGNKPLANEKVKVVIDQCTYEWSSNQYGELPPIAHLPGRNKIEIIGAGPDGTEDIVYSATAGIASQNVLLLKNFQIFTAKTDIHEEGEKTTTIYTVKKGDTLGRIARDLRTTVKRLADLNGIKDVNVISVGQQLKIPDGISKPQEVTSAQRGTQAVPTGTSDKGYPQANVGISTEQAPWMKIAYTEANERWQWGKVKEGYGKINYHHETGASNTTMTGTTNAWCASFINYCLQKSGFASSGSPNSQSYKHSPQFIRIEIPVYGAIVVFHKRGSKNSGHVAFVYCKTKDGEIGVLGGNQADSVTINPMKKIYFNPDLNYELIGYYIPVAYGEYAKKIVAKGGDLEPYYESIAELRTFLDSAAISEDDNKTR